MAVPDYETLMLPLLRLVAARGEVQVRDATAALSDEFNLSTDERSTLIPSGRGVTLMHSRVGWAKTYLKQAGLIIQPKRGWMSLSPEGRRVLAEAPMRLDNTFLLQFPGFREFVGRSRAASQADEPSLVFPGAAGSSQVADGASPASLVHVSPEERLSSAAGELQATLAAELIDRLRALPPDAFELLIVDLLLKMGFGGSRADAGARLGRSGDGGVDGVIREDILGLDVVYIQAKRNAADNPVGPDRVQAFAGSLLERGATKGVLATTARFTDAAIKVAERLSTQRRIVLIDGEELARLMIEHGVGVRTVQTIRIQRVDLSDYEEDE